MRLPLPRAQFPVAERFHYLNHAGICALPRATADAIAADADEVSRNGSTTIDARSDRNEIVRTDAARLLGVPVSDVAFVKNTTEGLGFVASGLEWSAGDRVVVPGGEFPSTAFPWFALRDRGVDVSIVEPRGTGGTLPLEAFATALAGHETKLVALSWVQFSKGWRTDLAALATLCHDHGALLCVDVIQGLGVIPCELAAWGVDFATADGHKWLLAPEGIGVLYVAQSVRDRLRVLEPGWNSVVTREEWDNLDLVLDDSARRFEGGTMNTALIAGLGASIELLHRAGDGDSNGIGAIWNHVSALGDRLCDGLADAGATVLSDRSVDGRSAIVTFTLPGVDAETVIERLREADVVCSPRGGGVRVAPHGYNDAADVDAVIDVVRNIAMRAVG